MKKNKKQQLFFLNLSALATLGFCVFFIFFFTNSTPDRSLQAVKGVSETAEQQKPDNKLLSPNLVNQQFLQESQIKKLSQKKGIVSATSPNKNYTAFITTDNLQIFDNQNNSTIYRRHSRELDNARISPDFPKDNQLFFWTSNSQLSFPVFNLRDNRFVANLVSLHAVEVSSQK